MTIQLKLLPTLALAMLALPMVAFAQSDVGDRAYEQADSVLKRLPNITRQMPSSSITDARLTSIVVVPVVTQQVVTPVLAFVPAAPPVAPLAALTSPTASAALVTSSDDVYSCLSQGFPSSYVGEVVYRRTLTNGVTTGYALFSNTCAAPASSAPLAPVAAVITTNNIVSSCQANGYGPGYTGQVTYAEQLTNGVRTSYTGVSNTCTAPSPTTNFYTPPSTPSVAISAPAAQCTWPQALQNYNTTRANIINDLVLFCALGSASCDIIKTNQFFGLSYERLMYNGNAYGMTTECTLEGSNSGGGGDAQ